jgi:hypothetical protein
MRDAVAWGCNREGARGAVLGVTIGVCCAVLCAVKPVCVKFAFVSDVSTLLSGLQLSRAGICLCKQLLHTDHHGERCQVRHRHGLVRLGLIVSTYFRL